jgi:capsid protein
MDTHAAVTPIRRPVVEPRKDPGSSLVRAVIAQAIATHDRSMRAIEVAERMWPGDQNVATVVRAAMSPTTIGNTAVLVPVVAAMVDALQPLSAAGELMARGIQVTADGGLVAVPGFSPGTATFVGEAAPIPVRQLVSAGPTLSPYKLATIVTLSMELLESTNAEPLARAALMESIGTGIDAVLFSATAAVAGVNPPGLLVGIPALTPSTATSKAEAMADDLVALTVALGPAAAAGVLFVAAPPQAAAITVRALTPLPNVRASSALPSGTVVAVATQAFVSMLGVPRIDSSIEAVLHMADPAEEFATGGVVAAPGRSLFQTAVTGLKMVTPTSWGLRAPTAVAWMDAVTW